MRASTQHPTLRLGTRGSLLARIQSQWVADKLEMLHPGLKVELVICRTTGDLVQDRPLHAIGGKGLFTKELEESLLDGRVDLVVHSMKDVPVTMPLVDQSSLTIAAIPRRADPRDVLVSIHGRTLMDLAIGARVGTGSLRRRCQILAVRPDVRVDMIRGNIDTRLAKHRARKYDAIVLAMAGLHRSGLYNADDMEAIPTALMLPAAGQGALGVQCRANDMTTRSFVAAIDDAHSRLRVELERAVVMDLDGDCKSPIAALATIEDHNIRLRAAVGACGGEPPIARAEAVSDLNDPVAALRDVMHLLEEQGARELLDGRAPSGAWKLTHVH